MTIGIIQVNHVNVTVPAALEAAAKHFYGVVLGLPEIPKPEGTRQNMGAWYRTRRHAASPYRLKTASPNEHERRAMFVIKSLTSLPRNCIFATAGVEIIPDGRPVRGQSRFFVRDPGGN